MFDILFTVPGQYSLLLFCTVLYFIQWWLMSRQKFSIVIALLVMLMALTVVITVTYNVVMMLMG